MFCPRESTARAKVTSHAALLLLASFALLSPFVLLPPLPELCTVRFTSHVPSLPHKKSFDKRFEALYTPDMTKQVDIPKLIKRVRRKHDLTQEALAQKLGVSVVTVNRWENGRARPHPVFVKKLQGIV